MLNKEGSIEYRQQEEDRHSVLADKQWQRGTELENLLKKAEKDTDAFRLVELARLIDPQAFKSRETQLETVQRMRLSGRGNDPAYQNAIQVNERVARLCIDFAVKKAEDVLNLMKTWN